MTCKITDSPCLSTCAEPQTQEREKKKQRSLFTDHSHMLYCNSSSFLEFIAHGCIL